MQSQITRLYNIARIRLKMVCVRVIQVRHILGYAFIPKGYVPHEEFG